MNKSKLRTLKVNESVKLDGAKLAEVNSLVSDFTKTNRAYQFDVKKQRDGVTITRVVPNTRDGKIEYISAISKTQLVSVLKKHKTHRAINAAKELGISERSVYRLIKRLNLSI